MTHGNISIRVGDKDLACTSRTYGVYRSPLAQSNDHYLIPVPAEVSPQRCAGKERYSVQVNAHLLVAAYIKLASPYFPGAISLRSTAVRTFRGSLDF